MDFDVQKIREINSCRICGHKPLLPILSLGELYISDFVDETRDNSRRAPLELVLCNENDGGCGLLQLRHTVSPDSLYRNYWYRSGVNKTMTEELGDVVQSIKKIINLEPGDFVIDIGSNDGTLLRSYDLPGIKLVGFEPARNIAERYGRDGIYKVIIDFFSHDLWQKEFGKAKAKVITAIAMFYDLDDPNSFVTDIKRCLDEEGIFVIQMSYAPSFLRRNAFDGICHEHLEYYSLLSLENLLNHYDLEVFDAVLRDINEGSFRVYIRHRGNRKNLKINEEEATERVQNMRNFEKKLGLSDRKIYDEFVKRIESIKRKVTDFIKKESAAGKKIYVYGASTKGNTLLQYFGLDNKLITAAAERNPDKWGKRTIGTNILIVSEEKARAEKPDYFLILPWHFLKEFKEREKEFLRNGGKLIVSLPQFEIIGYDS